MSAVTSGKHHLETNLEGGGGGGGGGREGMDGGGKEWREGV